MQFVWVRLGDADTYNRFDDLVDAAEYMAESRVNHVERCQRYGVAARGFTGNNYISLFVGDGKAQPTKDVSNKDIQAVNRALK
jgi:hypothetical protein